MSKSIFLSYVWEDRRYRDQVIDWAKQSLLGDVGVSVESEDYRSQGEGAIKAHLRPKINGVAAVVCLVGNDTHNHEWVKYELDVGESYHKTIILLRIPKTRGPAPIGHRHLPIHEEFTPFELRKLLGT